MADKVTYSVSCTPQEQLDDEHGGAHYVIAGEVGKSLGGSGAAVVADFGDTAAKQGYLNQTVNYHECSDSSDSSDLSAETSATFIFIKNTGYTFSSVTALGASLDKAVKVMAPGGTTLISILDPGEAIVLKDDNAGLDGRFHLRTVDLDGGNNTSAGHLAVEYLVID